MRVEQSGHRLGSGVFKLLSRSQSPLDQILFGVLSVDSGQTASELSSGHANAHKWFICLENLRFIRHYNN